MIDDDILYFGDDDDESLEDIGEWNRQFLIGAEDEEGDAEDGENIGRGAGHHKHSAIIWTDRHREFILELYSDATESEQFEFVTEMVKGWVETGEIETQIEDWEEYRDSPYAANYDDLDLGRGTLRYSVSYGDALAYVASMGLGSEYVKITFHLGDWYVYILNAHKKHGSKK